LIKKTENMQLEKHPRFLNTLSKSLKLLC